MLAAYSISFSPACFPPLPLPLPHPLFPTIALSPDPTLHLRPNVVLLSDNFGMAGFPRPRLTAGGGSSWEFSTHSAGTKSASRGGNFCSLQICTRNFSLSLLRWKLQVFPDPEFLREEAARGESGANLRIPEVAPEALPAMPPSTPVPARSVAAR
jgi:hypothetical protein